MIESFFQNLNSEQVEYLLISGQATVLYGAATFSEDVDLWVNPTATNAQRFFAALRSSSAKHYKLTPPWELPWLTRGHGFHFVLPGVGAPDVYLDVMAVPPRVRGFADAAANAQWMETDWGRVRVIGIPELIELKKTQRLEDYPIIGRLALSWLRQLARLPTGDEYRWALEQVFTLPELLALLEEYPAAAQAVPTTFPKCFNLYVEQLPAGPAEPVESELGNWLQGRISELQSADRGYWRRIITELKQLRSEGRLMAEGLPV